MLSEFHQTPHQVNYEWTEEQIELLFRKRNERMKRLAEEIKKLRDEEPREHTQEPRRVSNSDFFANINAMRAKGGSIAIQRVN